MKKIFEKFAIVVMMGLVPVMTSCQGLVDAVFGEVDQPSSSVTPTIIHIDGITITGYTADAGATATTTVEIGTKVQLSVVISPENTSELDITWKSNDESVVKVYSDGLIEAVGIGEAVITVTSKIDTSVSATLTVKVKDASLNINNNAIDQSHADARG